MKRLLALLILGAMACLAQTVALYTSPAQLPATGGVTQVGTAGTTTYCYWVVAVYTGGKSAPAGPMCTSGSNATLSSSNYNTITFSAPTGPTSAPTGYDLLRTTTTSTPTGACACAVSTAQSGSPLNDQSNSLSAYTVSTVAATRGAIFGDQVTTSGSVYMKHQIDGVISHAIKNPTSTVNYIQQNNSATGNAVGFQAIGTDNNIGYNVVTKGSGTFQVNGIAQVTATGDMPNVTYSLQGSATVAEVNAGKVILAASTGRTLKIVGFLLQAIGGNTGGCTAVQIADTTGTPVVGVSVAVAALTQNTVVTEATATTVTLTTFLTALTADKGLQIIKTGGDCTTATSFNYHVSYTIN